MNIFGFIADVINLIFSPRAFFRGKKTVIGPATSPGDFKGITGRVLSRWGYGPEKDLLEVWIPLTPGDKLGMEHKYLVPVEEVEFDLFWKLEYGWSIKDSKGVTHIHYHE